MWAMVDLTAFPIHGMSTSFLRAFLSPWQYQGLGRAVDFDYREVLLAALAFVLRDNGELTQKVFYLSLLPVAAFATYSLVRFLGVRSRVAAVGGALLYAFNSITFSQFTGAPGQLVTIALLPVMVVGIVQISDRSRYVRGTMLVSAAFAVITSFNPYFPLIAAPLFLLFWCYSLFRFRSLRVLAAVTGAFGLSFLLTFVLTLPSSLPTLQLLLASQQAAVGSFVGDSLPALVSQMRLCYNDSVPLQLFRGTGNPCTLDSALGYSELTFWTQLGLLLPLAGFTAMLVPSRDSKRDGYVAVFAALALITIACAWQIHLDNQLTLFRRFQFLFLLRNPIKISMFLPLAYAPLAAFTADGLLGLVPSGRELARRLPVRAGPSALAGVFLLGSLGLVGYNWPMVTGDMGLYRLFGTDWLVPPMYYRASEWLTQRREEQGFFRTLWMPYDHNTQLRLAIDPAGVTAIDEESGITSQANVGYVNGVLKALCGKETDHFGALLAPANVRYLVVDLTSKQTGDCQAAGLEPHGAPSAFLSLLDGQSDLKRVAGDQDWVVYENQSFIPHLALFDNIRVLPTLADVRSALAGSADTAKLYVSRDSPALTQADVDALEANTKQTEADHPTAESSLRITQLSDTRFVIDLTVQKPAYLVFGETYHPLWNAYYADGTSLMHFPAFYYANGYLVDRTGEIQLTLEYGGQDARNFEIAVSAAGWLTVGAGAFALAWRRSARRPGGVGSG